MWKKEKAVSSPPWECSGDSPPVPRRTWPCDLGLLLSWAALQMQCLPRPASPSSFRLGSKQDGSGIGPKPGVAGTSGPFLGLLSQCPGGGVCTQRALQPPVSPSLVMPSHPWHFLSCQACHEVEPMKAGPTFTPKPRPALCLSWAQVGANAGEVGAMFSPFCYHPTAMAE